LLHTYPVTTLEGVTIGAEESGEDATEWNDPSARDSGLEMYLDMKAIKAHLGEALLVLKN
jgi:hypothetical protein